MFGRSLALGGGLVQEPELVGTGDEVVFGGLATLGVVPLVKCQPGGCLEESARRAVAGDELGRLVPGLEVDEDPVGSTWFVDGHPHGGDGLAGCGGDLHFGSGAESAGDGDGVHGISSMVGCCWTERAPG